MQPVIMVRCMVAILMMEMLLSWEALVNESDEEFTTITFSDIDWMRNRQKRNKAYIEENYDGAVIAMF